MEDNSITPDMAMKELARRELLRRESSNGNQQSNNFFKMNFPEGQSLTDIEPSLKNPEQIGKGTLEAVGTLGMMASPQLTVMKGIGMIPNAINAISRAGTSGIFGAMANPEHPIEGGIMGAGVPAAMNFLTKSVPAAINRVTPEHVGEAIRGTYNNLLSKAEGLFGHVENEVNKRGINNLPVNTSFIRNLKKYFPKTEASKELLNKAEQGDYEALRKVQSDLYKRGSDAKHSDYLAEQDKGAIMHEKRNKLNKFMSEHFKRTGHADLASSLEEANKIYRNLKSTFDVMELPKSIRNIYNPKVEEIPGNLLQTLSRKNKSINKLVESHPLIAEALENAIGHQNAIKSIKRLGLLGGGALGLEGAMSIANKFLPRQE